MNEAARCLIREIDDIMLEDGQDWSACTTTEPDSSGALDMVEFRVMTPHEVDSEVQSRLAATFRSHMPTPFMLKVHFYTPKSFDPYAIVLTSKALS